MKKTIRICDICGGEVPATNRVCLTYIGDAFRDVAVRGREQDAETLSHMVDLCPECMAHGVTFKYGTTRDEVILIGKDVGRCASCYYYQIVYDHGRPTDRRACFGEHLRVAVCGLDWDEEAEAWAETEPEDFCSKWAPK